MPRFTTRDGCNLEYRLRGEGPLLTLTPGGREGGETIVKLTEALAGHATVLTSSAAAFSYDGPAITAAGRYLVTGSTRTGTGQIGQIWIFGLLTGTGGRKGHDPAVTARPGSPARAGRCTCWRACRGVIAPGR